MLGYRVCIIYEGEFKTLHMNMPGHLMAMSHNTPNFLFHIVGFCPTKIKPHCLYDSHLSLYNKKEANGMTYCQIVGELVVKMC